MRRRATSCRTSSAKWSLIMLEGTLPLRKPGRRASFWTREKAFCHAARTTSGPSSTCSLRLQALTSSTATFIRAPDTRVDERHILHHREASCLQLAEGHRHARPRRAERGRHAAHQAHEQREGHAPGHEDRGDPEREGEMGEGLPVHRPGGQRGEGQYEEAAEPAGRWKTCLSTVASHQSSESNAVPPASTTPTTVHVPPPNRTVSPRSRPSYAAATFLPTTSSVSPGRNIRPATSFTLGRTSRALGEPP